MGILEQLNRSANIRKIFGRRELIIIQKQLLGVKLTQSEKNRLSRDIRKKFEAIKEISQFQSDFGLKYGKEIKKAIEEAKEVILNSKYHSKIKKIILFGSTADNTRTLKSDIDIAVEFYGIDKKEATQFRIDTVKKLRDNMDIQAYNFLPEKLKNEINKKGRLIYGKTD